MIRLTADQQKKGAIIGGFVVLMAGILYYELHDSTPAPVPAPAPIVASAPARVVPASHGTGTEAKKLGTTSAQLDPTLRMEPMLVTESLVYSGTGRNIFSASSMPVELPKPIASVRKVTAPVGPPPPPPGPPPPPPIDLRFFGTETLSTGARRAFLLHGDDVFVASDGDVVQRRYKILTVSANSILVEDMSNNNRQTLPLVGH